MYEGFQKNMSGTALHDYRRILHVLLLESGAGMKYPAAVCRHRCRTISLVPKKQMC